MKISLSQAKPIFSLAVLIAVFSTLTAFGQTPEPFSLERSPLATPTSPVMDYAGVIDAATKAALEKRVIAYKASSGVELGVAVVNTTGDRPIFDYSLAVARGWGLGSKEDDNPSALLFVAIDDRKYFTQVSRNLEDELPDGVVGSLQRQFLVPEFRNRNYGKGISDTIEAYIRTIESKRTGTQTPTPEATTGSESDGAGGFGLFCCLAIVLVVILIAIASRGGGGGGRSRRDRDRWGGGGFGGALPWIIGSAIANAASSSSSSSSDWGGSSWGGGGGSDWGGFGGGGDFGGGGAGGDW